MRFSSGTIVDYYLIINKLYSDDRRNSKHPTYIYIHTYLYINIQVQYIRIYIYIYKYNTYIFIYTYTSTIHTYLYIHIQVQYIRIYINIYKYNTYMHHLDCRFIELQLKLEVRTFAKFFSNERKKICYFLVKLIKTNSFLFIYYSYLIIVNLHNLYTFN